METIEVAWVPYLNVDPYQAWMLSGQKYGSVKSSAPGLGSTMCHNNQSARDDIADKDFVCDRQIWFLFA